MLNTNTLYGSKVVDLKTNKKLGFVDSFIIKDKKCFGFIVKQPDLLLMFHRKKLVLSWSSCVFSENCLCVKPEKNTDIKKLKNLNFSKWKDSPVLFQNRTIGNVSYVNFNLDGSIESVELDKGKISNLVLGKSVIEISHIKELSNKKSCVILKDNAKIKEYQNGLAEKAGKVSSVVVHKLKIESPKLIDSLQEQSDKIHTMFYEFTDEIKKGME